MIKNYLSRRIDAVDKNRIGESWDLCDRDNDQSIVENGFLKGYSISALRKEYGKILFGEYYDINKKFPIMVKIIDAKEDLSLQVHPPKNSLLFLPKGAETKDEFWYVLETQGDAKIIAGLKNSNKREQFMANYDSKDIIDCMQIHDSTKDTLIYLPSGIVHTIGAGNLILEIQENSDTTYRISDWGRADINGIKRELHMEEAVKCIDFSNSNKVVLNKINVDITTKVIDAASFESHNIFITNSTVVTTAISNCKIISITNGTVAIQCSNEELILKRGESALLPANLTFILNSYDSTWASCLLTISK